MKMNFTEKPDEETNKAAPPEECTCYFGDLTRNCLTCTRRSVARERMAAFQGIEPKEIPDAVDSKGFCTSCSEVKDLEKSRPAPRVEGCTDEEQAVCITCADCLRLKR